MGVREQEQRAHQAALGAEEVLHASYTQMRKAEGKSKEAVHRSEEVKWRIEGAGPGKDGTVDDPRVTHAAQRGYDHDALDERPHVCYGGFHYIGVEEDGAEHYEPVRCRRSEQGRRGG